MCVGINIKLRDVLNELSSVRIKWLEIGIQLGIDMSELKCFQVSQTVPNPMHLLSDVLTYWMDEHTDVPVSWNSLVAVLRSPSVNEQILAESIYSKYILTTETKADDDVMTKNAETGQFIKTSLASSHRALTLYEDS